MADQLGPGQGTLGFLSPVSAIETCEKMSLVSLFQLLPPPHLGCLKNLSQQSRPSCCRQEWPPLLALTEDQVLYRPQINQSGEPKFFRWNFSTCCSVIRSDCNPAKCRTSLKILRILIIRMSLIIFPVFPTTSNSSRPS